MLPHYYVTPVNKEVVPANRLYCMEDTAGDTSFIAFSHSWNN